MTQGGTTNNEEVLQGSRAVVESASWGFRFEGFWVLRVCWVSFFLWAALAVRVYTSCVLRGTFHFFNKTLLLIKKNNEEDKEGNKTLIGVLNSRHEMVFN
jgi:hypothetical protein